VETGGPSPADERLLGVLIPAVGGQGGGVLSEWIVDAAGIQGLDVHGTSIPGVAQRTGSTSYYVEVFTGDGSDPPVHSLFPVPGALDVLLAPEFLEIGRAIELGFPSPSRTTIIASTHRLYSIHEKMAVGRGIYPRERLEAAARAFSRRLCAFDALAVAREHGTEVNALLLGALAGSGALPIGDDAYRKAIERRGIQVERNLRGFEIGLTLARDGARPATPDVDAREHRPSGAGPAGLAEDGLAGVPPTLRPLIEEAWRRLVDYQDRRYAASYLARLRPFLEGGDVELARLVARHLAVWMTYEDAIRVADLKTRAGRFERIRSEAGGRDALIEVTDYLKPDLDEIYGILPHRLVAPFARWAERRWPRGRPTLAQHVRTTTVTGYLRLWVLARCRRLRPHSYRAHEEHGRIDRWLDAVSRGSAADPALGHELARAAQLVKGYGDVRRRMVKVFADLLDVSLDVAEVEAGGGACPIAAALACRYRTLVLGGPEGEGEARSLAAMIREHLRAGDLDAARRAVGL
jgi:indolepyruvate ferredoxin oxidoreductase beta subunit